MTIDEIIGKCGLSSEEEAEYREYIANGFSGCTENTVFDTSFLDKWHSIASFAAEYGAEAAINRFVCPKRPVDFKSPESIWLEIYHSFAGEIPIIYLPHKDDFEALVTNSIYKGIRPDSLSETGASFAFGKTTRFILLSAKPYSNVPACEMGISDEEWAERSMIIRREHECTHYFTKQNYGLSQNRLHDEIMADFFGLYEAFGYYKAEHFLKFMGIVGTSGGRLKFYTEGLSDKVRQAVSETAASASAYLESFAASEKFSGISREERVKHLCKIGLEGMCNNA